MTKVALITSNRLRHRWVASRVAASGLLAALIVEDKPAASDQNVDDNRLVKAYFAERDAREAWWFAEGPAAFPDLGVPVHHVSWSESNSESALRFVTNLFPDRVALFGSSIIRDPLLSRFAPNIINMHLGLSPYYRGSATNFWPLVHDRPECVGVTVHHATLKVDGGHILGQRRPPVDANDTSHDLGCKAIIEGAALLVALLSMTNLPAGQAQTGEGVLCRRRDFTADALDQMQRNFESGMMPRYIGDKRRRDERYPIVVGA